MKLNELIIDVEQKMFVNNVDKLRKVLEFFFNFESEIDMNVTINSNQIELKSLGKLEEKIIVINGNEKNISSVEDVFECIL